MCHVLFVILTPVSIKKEKKIREKKVQKKEKKKKRKIQKISKRRGKGLNCGLLMEKISLHIQILGDLYTSNIICFEHIKSLDF